MQQWQMVESNLSILCNRKDKEKRSFNIRMTVLFVLFAAFGKYNIIVSLYLQIHWLRKTVEMKF